MAERQLQPWDDVSLLAGTWVAAGTANDEHAVERMLLRVSPTGELSGLVDDGDGEFEESDCKIGNSSAWISSGGYWVAFDQIYSDDGSTTRWEAQYFEDTDTLEGSWTGDCAGFFVAHRLRQMESLDRDVNQPLPADCEPESEPEAELSGAAELARLRSELEAEKSAHTVTETTKRHAAAQLELASNSVDVLGTQLDTELAAHSATRQAAQDAQAAAQDAQAAALAAVSAAEEARANAETRVAEALAAAATLQQRKEASSRAITALQKLMARPDAAKIFARFDLDEDGKVSKDEMQIGLHLIGEDLDDIEMDELMAFVDADGDGSIDTSEFVRLGKMRDELERIGAAKAAATAERDAAFEQIEQLQTASALSAANAKATLKRLSTVEDELENLKASTSLGAVHVQQLEQLLVGLSTLSLKDLRLKVATAGVDDHAIELARDSDEPKAALTALLIHAFLLELRSEGTRPGDLETKQTLKAEEQGDEEVETHPIEQKTLEPISTPLCVETDHEVLF